MSKSNRPKREKLKTIRTEKRAEQAHLELLSGLKAGTIIPVDKSKIFSRCALPKIPDYYLEPVPNAERACDY